MSEYEPLFPFRSGQPVESRELRLVRRQFQEAAQPYLSTPWSWLAWAVLLPAVALASRPWAAAGRWPMVLFAWSATILVGGAVEALAIRRGGRGLRPSPLASWALRSQGNLSLIAVALSALLIWVGEAWTLPGLWLLLLGHSFYSLGGLSGGPLRRYGLIYQGGGLAALSPWLEPLQAFAVTAALANLYLAFRIWRDRDHQG